MDTSCYLSSHLSKNWIGSSLLKFSDLTGRSAFSVTWPPLSYLLIFIYYWYFRPLVSSVEIYVSSSHCHHHYPVAPSARISLTLYCHPSLSSIASGRSSRLHPVSTQGWCMYVRAGRPAFARPCEGGHRSTSLMSSSLLLQQFPVYLVHLVLIGGVVSRTCSILLAAFLCNCRQAFSPSV